MNRRSFEQDVKRAGSYGFVVLEREVSWFEAVHILVCQFRFLNFY